MIESSRLPVGASSFEALRAANKIYVDKTELVYRLTIGRGKVIFARPSGFGKTLLLSTFASLFEHGLRDFKGLAIEKLWTDEPERYRIIHLDLSTFADAKSDSEFRQRFYRALRDQCGLQGYEKEIANDTFLIYLADWLDEQPGSSMVILIDDYDFSTSVLKSNAKEFESARSAILQFYLILKSTEGSFRFQMLAGEKSYYRSGYMEMFGDFNNMNDISVDADYAALGGFTEEEIRQYFKPDLEAAAKRLRITDDELMALLRERFGGYSFEEPDFFTSIERPKSDLFCPAAVVNFLAGQVKG